MKLDRAIASKTLTDNFCLLYGEKFRGLFETNGEKIIDLGIENGKKHYTQYAIHNTTRTSVIALIKFFNPNKDYNTVEEMKAAITKQLKPFLSNKDITKILTEKEYSSFNESKFAYPDGIEPLQNAIIKGIGKSKPTPTKAINFDYFKQFPVFDTHRSVNLATEAGLGLDQFNYKEVKYYLEENEEFYLSEAIAYKYHGLGSVLAREELRAEMVEKIKANITPNSDYSVKNIVKYMLKAYCFPSEEDSSLMEIQTVSADSFKTAKQVSDSLKDIDPSIFPKNLFNENKIIRKFKDF